MKVKIEALEYIKDLDMQPGDTKFVTYEQAVYYCTGCGWAKTDDESVENGTRSTTRTALQVQTVVHNHMSKEVI